MDTENQGYPCLVIHFPSFLAVLCNRIIGMRKGKEDLMDKRSKTIFLIEDNTGVADALVLLLEKEGYHVEVWV